MKTEASDFTSCSNTSLDILYREKQHQIETHKGYVAQFEKELQDISIALILKNMKGI